jgi:carbamoyl-phosphate synthase large subunit
MSVCDDREALERFVAEAAAVEPDHPVLVDRYVAGAVEVDVDAVSDGADLLIGGVMEHVEEAGVHSGDSACSLPPVSLAPAVVAEIEEATRRLARALGVVGLLNVQYAVRDGEVYVLEVNPRASRTIPFVSKATGVPLARIAARVMTGRRLRDLVPSLETPRPADVSAKEVVLPFGRFEGTDVWLGPEMRSTGEVMGIAPDFPRAYAKALLASGTRLPAGGTAVVSVRDDERPAGEALARDLEALGFRVVEAPNADAALVVQTRRDDGDATQREIRRRALLRGIPLATTLAGARAIVAALGAARAGLEPVCLQDRPGRIRAG